MAIPLDDRPRIENLEKFLEAGRKRPDRGSARSSLSDASSTPEISKRRTGWILPDIPAEVVGLFIRRR